MKHQHVKLVKRGGTRISELDYPARRARAREWTDLAERQLRSYTWQPSLLEVTIAEQLMRAARCPTQTMPPYPDDELWVRLRRLSGWAPVLRLAIMAGDWRLPVDRDGEVLEIGPPPPGVTVTLERLVVAVYPLARIVEQWDREHNHAPAKVRTEREAAALMADRIPGLYDHLADAEKAFIGYGSIGVMFTVIATGLVD
uniref:hypothetical protein n=1 Tax=Pseudonocardia sp. CA-138482 TaxID=3240023 RepID=UPI003F4925FE